MTQLRKLRYTVAVLAVALMVVACNSGPGKSPEMTLSPPEWLHGKWMSPAVPGAVVEVTSDNWIDSVTPLDVKMSGYDLVSNERSSDTAYSFSYPLDNDVYEGVITFLVAKTDTGITIQTAFDPPHPVFGTESPVLPFTRVPM